MQTTVFFLLGVLLLTLQTSLFQVFPDWFGRPDLLFVLFIFLCTRTGMMQGATLALLYGFIMDIYAGVFLGIYTFLYLGLFFTVQVVAKHFTLNDPSYQSPLVAVTYLLVNIGVVIFSMIFASENAVMWAWVQVLLQMLVLSVITIPLFHIFELIRVRLDHAPTKLSIQQTWIGGRFRR